jgi:DNA-binding beta-propeller fold protein YncE
MVLTLSHALISLAFADAGRSFVIKTISLGKEGWENGSPSSIAINPETNLVYVANRNSNDSPDNITVINSTSNEVVGSISVGCPAVDVAVNPNTGTIYSANGYNTASAINGTTNEVIATFDYSDSSEYGASVQNVAVNTETNKVYILLTAGGTAFVSVINGETNEIESTFKVIDLGSDEDVGRGVRDIAVNSKTNTMYITYDFDSLIVIDGSDNQVVKTVQVEGPVNIAINEQTNTVYTSNFFSQSVSIIDGSNSMVIDTLKLFSDLQQITVDEITNTIYVASYGVGVSVINGTSHKIEDRIPAEEFSEGIAFNPNNSLLYVANAGSNSISIIQAATNQDWQTHYAVNGFVNTGPADPYQVFKIQYRVVNGTVEQFSMPYETYTHNIRANVTSDGNGVLQIKFPKNYPSGNDELGGEAIAFINEQEIFPEHSITDCFFEFSLPFSNDAVIDLVWTFYDDSFRGIDVPERCTSETIVQDVVKKNGIITPLHQMKAGVVPAEVVCGDNLELVSHPNGKPYCATPASAEILKERWK